MFTVPQVQLILDVTELIDWQTITLLTFYIGMRLGDARGLTWTSVDLDKRTITWIPQKTKRKRQRKAKIVTLPMHPVLYAHLRRVHAMRGESEYVTPSQATRPISNLSDDFVELVRDAKIDVPEYELPCGKKRRLLTHHRLRHLLRNVDQTNRRT